MHLRRLRQHRAEPEIREAHRVLRQRVGLRAPAGQPIIFILLFSLIFFPLIVLSPRGYFFPGQMEFIVHMRAVERGAGTSKQQA